MNGHEFSRKLVRSNHSALNAIFHQYMINELAKFQSLKRNKLSKGKFLYRERLRNEKPRAAAKVTKPKCWLTGI